MYCILTKALVNIIEYVFVLDYMLTKCLSYLFYGFNCKTSYTL